MHPAKVKNHQRQEAILLSLRKLDYLSRRQIQKLHSLKSDRNAQRVLQSMQQYLFYFIEGERIYYLSKEGRKAINCDTVRNKITTAQHYIMRNDLYIFLNRPAEWENEIKIISGQGKNETTIVTDALFTRNRKYHIIEIDNQQKMKKNRTKIDKYRRLIERNAFGSIMPQIIWVTTSKYRQKALYNMCEGLDVKCYLTTDLI